MGCPCALVVTRSAENCCAETELPGAAAKPKRLSARDSAFADGDIELSLAVAVSLLHVRREIGLRVEIKGFKQVGQCRHVGWDVGIASPSDWIGEIVAAAIGYRLEAPGAWDGIHQRDMGGGGQNH